MPLLWQTFNESFVTPRKVSLDPRIDLHPVSHRLKCIVELEKIEMACLKETLSRQL